MKSESKQAMRPGLGSAETRNAETRESTRKYKTQPETQRFGADIPLKRNETQIRNAKRKKRTETHSVSKTKIETRPSKRSVLAQTSL